MGLKLCRLVPWGILLIGRSLPIFLFPISYFIFLFFCAAFALVVFPVESLSPFCSKAHKAQAVEAVEA